MNKIPVGAALGAVDGKLEVGLKEGLTEFTNDGGVVGLPEGLTEGFAEGGVVGLKEGLSEGFADGGVVGLTEGLAEGVAVGLTEGFAVGGVVGLTEGLEEGGAVGLPKGLAEGFAVGGVVGLTEGLAEGFAVGGVVGLIVGMEKVADETPVMITGFGDDTASKSATSGRKCAVKFSTELVDNVSLISIQTVDMWKLPADKPMLLQSKNIGSIVSLRQRSYL